MDLDYLRSLGSKRRRVWVQTSKPSDEIVEILHREHLRQRPIDLLEAQDWALNAVLAARRLSTKTSRDLLPRSLAHFANCHRIGRRFDAAFTNMLVAQELALDASPLAQAEIANVYSTLLIDVRRLSEAEALLRQSEESIKRFGSQHDFGVLVSRFARLDALQGRPKEAVFKCVQGLDLIEVGKSPIVTLSLMHNLAWALALCGQAEIAQDTLSKTHSELYSLLYGDKGTWRRQWLRALISRAEGDFATSASILESLRSRELPLPSSDRLFLEVELKELFGLLGLQEAEADARSRAKTLRTRLGIKVAV